MPKTPMKWSCEVPDTGYYWCWWDRRDGEGPRVAPARVIRHGGEAFEVTVFGGPSIAAEGCPGTRIGMKFCPLTPPPEFDSAYPDDADTL
jgi:hypothetical protein